LLSLQNLKSSHFIKSANDYFADFFILKILFFPAFFIKNNVKLSSEGEGDLQRKNRPLPKKNLGGYSK